MNDSDLMKNTQLPAIIVVTYNRINSLKRLLNSISKASYGDIVPDLIISIDYSDTHQKSIKTIAEQFEWQGQKQIICHPKNLGLKKHIFYCGDLTETYDSVIILEDDLFVSQGFFKYTQQALEACEKQNNIAGIALYNNTFNESASLPFEAIKDNGDFYLMQVPCSWGQVWTKAEWKAYKKWYKSSFNYENFSKLPKGISGWSQDSWKKPCFLYLAETQTYFAYPYISYSMNLNEAGTNVRSKDFKFLNGLELTSDVSTLTLNNNAPKYGMAYMLLSKSLNYFNPGLKNYDYLVDLFGSQLENYDDDQWLITALEVSQYEKAYGLELKPIELNIIYGIRGEALFLTQKKHIRTTRLSRFIINYYYPIPEWYFPFFQRSILDRIKGVIFFWLTRIKFK